MADPSARPEPRVELRPATPADAGLLHRWRAEREVQRHQRLPDVTVGHLRGELERQDHRNLPLSRGDRFQWIVLADGKPAGWVTLAVTSWEHGLAEIGYALSTPFHGRGIMSRALTTLLPWLFRETILERLEARCSVHHEASRRVLEQAGFQREGLLRGCFVVQGERIDHHLSALLRGDLGR